MSLIALKRMGEVTANKLLVHAFKQDQALIFHISCCLARSGEKHTVHAVNRATISLLQVYRTKDELGKNVK